MQQAILILEQHISTIKTVSEWADKMGYKSERYFSRKIRNYFGKRPKELIVEMKITKIHECISHSPDDMYYSIAKKFGFEDDNAFYKFVKRHTGKSPTELKTIRQLKILANATDF